MLLQHSEIIDAAVVGVLAADGLSEVPRAYVVRRQRQANGAVDVEDGESLTAEEVYRFSRQRLASYKALDGGVCFVKNIPRTPSGKIQRRKLTAMHEYNGEVVRQVLDQSRTVNEQTMHAREGAVSVLDPLASSKASGGAVRRSPRLRSSGGESDGQSSALRELSTLQASRTTTERRARPSQCRVQKGKSHAPKGGSKGWKAEELGIATSIKV